jgi:hypothetical protein
MTTQATTDDGTDEKITDAEAEALHDALAAIHDVEVISIYPCSWAEDGRGPVRVTLSPDAAEGLVELRQVAGRFGYSVHPTDGQPGVDADKRTYWELRVNC